MTVNKIRERIDRAIAKDATVGDQDFFQWLGLIDKIKGLKCTDDAAGHQAIDGIIKEIQTAEN